MYQLLLYVHIICAVIWVGGAVYAQLLGLRVARSTDPSELPHLARHVEFIGSRVFSPAALLLFISGAVMTMQAWAFGQAWIAISVALWVISALVGAVYLGPRVKRAAELFEAEGPTSEAGRALIDRMFLVTRLELVGFAIVIALMTFKPGA
jgi:uncharacterized membrane protein